jgi:hypothetical protein
MWVVVGGGRFLSFDYSRFLSLYVFSRSGECLRFVSGSQVFSDMGKPSHFTRYQYFCPCFLCAMIALTLCSCSPSIRSGGGLK